jgi:hypothetical protein
MSEILPLKVDKIELCHQFFGLEWMKGNVKRLLHKFKFHLKIRKSETYSKLF